MECIGGAINKRNSQFRFEISSTRYIQCIQDKCGVGQNLQFEVMEHPQELMLNVLTCLLHHFLLFRMF